MPRASGGGARPTGGYRPSGGFRPYRHHRPYGGWYGGGWGYYPIYVDTDYSNEPEGTLCRRFIDGMWQKGRIINGTCVLGAHKFKESSADGESAVWNDCTGDRYSSFDPYSLSGVQAAQNIANQQANASGKGWDFATKLLDVGSNLIGALGTTNKQQNVTVSVPPPTPQKGISTLGWIGIGAGVILVGVLTFVAVKK